MADPFLPTRAKTAWTRFGPLHTELQKLATASFPDMGLALADLTLGANVGDYGGSNDENQFYTGSQPKIAILLAAFRLRERARASGKSGKSQEDLFAQIEKDWRPVVEKAIPDKPADFPKLDRILKAADPKAPATIDFIGGAKPWKDLDKAHGKGFDATFGFLDRVKLSLGWSDNTASGACVADLGRQYLNGAVASEGLFDPKSKTGLWLSGNYDGKMSGQWETDKSLKLIQGATPAAMASFLSMLQTDGFAKLTSAEHQQMRDIMGVPWFSDTLTSAGRAVNWVYGKVGINGSGSDTPFRGFVHDCGVIERTAGPNTLRYAAVTLNAKDNSVLNDVILKMDDLIQKFGALAKLKKAAAPLKKAVP